MNRYVQIRCARDSDPECLKVVAVDADELSGPGGDPDLLPIVVAQDGWMDDPDGDGVICRRCATKEELNDLIDQRERMEREHMERMADDDL